MENVVVPGCGLALAAKYAALRDSTEFIWDGPHLGLTPFGGLTHLLAREETRLKFPGLAEFIVLTGTSLFAGDALRLGWTDLFSTLPDLTFHIKEWFDSTEHLHNDAVAWQLGHLLETCFRMKDSHTSAMERSAVTPTRARWIEEAFADQPSVDEVLVSLSGIEKLSLQDPLNGQDAGTMTPFTLRTVDAGVTQLAQTQLRYTLAPWDYAAPTHPIAVKPAAEIFLNYVLESHNGREVVMPQGRAELQRWKAQREAEYRAFRELRAAGYARHVYARLEGCENRLVELDFWFTFTPPDDAAADADAAAPPDRRTLAQLHRALLTALDMPLTRPIELGWYLPTLDTAPIRTDAELEKVLHHDPGVEDPAAGLTYPPVYFLVKRPTLYFSEWAYAVKHHLLLQCPFALKASLALLTTLVSAPAAGLAEALDWEYHFFIRLLRRPDFYAVGQYTTQSPEAWETAHAPAPAFEDVFERDVRLDGHAFGLRPRWSPRTVGEVDPGAIAALTVALTPPQDGTVALRTRVETRMHDRLAGKVADAGGVEWVAGLGTPEAAAVGLVDHAWVPTNVNFYEMARHPWADTASSWRRPGWTTGSAAYFEAQYEEAAARVYDEAGAGDVPGLLARAQARAAAAAGGGLDATTPPTPPPPHPARRYWPPSDAVTSTHSDVAATATALLEERLFGELRRAAGATEPWATRLRADAGDGKLRYPVELATPAEKIYDDEYYRWFITPGHHPNPSGLVLGRKKAATTGAGEGEGEGESEGQEWEAFLRDVMSGEAAAQEEAEEERGVEFGQSREGMEEGIGIGEGEGEGGSE